MVGVTGFVRLGDLRMSIVPRQGFSAQAIAVAVTGGWALDVSDGGSVGCCSNGCNVANCIDIPEDVFGCLCLIPSVSRPSVVVLSLRC